MGSGNGNILNKNVVTIISNYEHDYMNKTEYYIKLSVIKDKIDRITRYNGPVLFMQTTKPKRKTPSTTLCVTLNDFVEFLSRYHRHKICLVDGKLKLYGERYNKLDNEYYDISDINVLMNMLDRFESDAECIDTGSNISDINVLMNMLDRFRPDGFLKTNMAILDVISSLRIMLDKFVKDGGCLKSNIAILNVVSALRSMLDIFVKEELHDRLRTESFDVLLVNNRVTDIFSYSDVERYAAEIMKMDGAFEPFILE